MQKGKLLNLLNRLGIQALDINDNWVRVCCPLAETNHASKTDTNPSAGFLINDEGPSAFNCFVCGSRSIESILNTYKWKRGFDLFGDYYDTEIVEQKQEINYLEKFLVKKDNTPVPVPEQILNLFKPIDHAKEYLHARGVDLDIAREAGLKYCDYFVTTEGKVWKNAIMFPIRDTDFKTYWIHFRSIDSKFFWHGQPKHFGLDIEWGRDDSFFGTEFLDLSKPVVVVEGPFDCLRLKTLGLDNALGTHGGISDKSKKLHRLKALNPVSIMSGFDVDNAGAKFTKAIKSLFSNVHVLDWNIVGCKDAGELKTKEDLEIVLKQRNLKFQDKWRVKTHDLV